MIKTTIFCDACNELMPKAFLIAGRYKMKKCEFTVLTPDKKDICFDCFSRAWESESGCPET